MLGLNIGSRDCIFIIKSRTGDLVSKNCFQYDSHGDSDNIGTTMVKDNNFCWMHGLPPGNKLSKRAQDPYLKLAVTRPISKAIKHQLSSHIRQRKSLPIEKISDFSSTKCGIIHHWTFIFLLLLVPEMHSGDANPGVPPPLSPTRPKSLKYTLIFPDIGSSPSKSTRKFEGFVTFNNCIHIHSVALTPECSPNRIFDPRNKILLKYSLISLCLMLCWRSIFKLSRHLVCLKNGYSQVGDIIIMLVIF